MSMSEEHKAEIAKEVATCIRWTIGDMVKNLGYRQIHPSTVFEIVGLAIVKVCREVRSDHQVWYGTLRKGQA